MACNHFGSGFTCLTMVIDHGYPNPDEMEVLPGMMSPGMMEELRNFAARYNYSIDDPDLIRRFRMYEDGKHDIATRIEVAERKAAEKAEKKAVKNNNIKVAKSCKQHGVDPAIISSATGLSLDEIARL